MSKRVQMADQEVEQVATELNGDGLPHYTKGDLLCMSWYSHKRKLLRDKLADDAQYTLAEVDKLMS